MNVGGHELAGLYHILCKWIDHTLEKYDRVNLLQELKTETVKTLMNSNLNCFCKS